MNYRLEIDGLNEEVSNLLSAPSNALFGGLTIYSAPTAPLLAEKYHIPLINLAVALAIDCWVGRGVVMVATFAVSAFSWKIVERPSVKLKCYTSRSPSISELTGEMLTV